MSVRKRITNILLWLSVIVWGCMLGGILYETLVVIPAWTAAIPESLNLMTHPQYPIVPAKMWIPFSNLNTLLSIAVLIAAWNQPVARRWLIVALVVVVLSWIMQFGFFWRQIGVMISPQSTVAEIVSAAQSYELVNWFRIIYIGLGFFATLYAFRASIERQMRS